MRITLLTKTIVLICMGTAHAEIPKKSPEQLKEQSSNIVVGKVQAVYTHSETNGDFAKIKGVVEIRIDSIEKGEGLEKGGLLYARYWRTAWQGDPAKTPPYGSGHYAINKEIGSTVRAFVSRNKQDQGFDILLTNGLQEIKKSGTVKESSTPK